MLAYLYGSMVDGSALPTNDLDIGLVLEPGCALSAYERIQSEFNIAAEIERCCGVRERDVRALDVAPLAVQGRVVSEGVLLQSKVEAFCGQYEISTRKRYFDFLLVVEMMRTSFFQQKNKEGLIHGKTRKG
jgi:predicted nucleotidyltransferase